MFSIGPQDKLPVAASAYLLPGEQVLYTVRKHPAVLAGAFLLMLGSLLAAVVLSTTVARPYPPVILILWGLWLITAGYCLWRFVNWSVTFFIITEYRLLLITGVFDTEVGMMPLTKVTDMRYSKPFTGKMLGYGDFIVESAGQDQALRRIDHVPYSEFLYREICEEIFDKENAKRKRAALNGEEADNSED